MLERLQVISPAFFLRCMSIVGVLLLTACLPGGPAQTKIPIEQMQAKSANEKKILVVVLPGRGDDVANIKASGIADAIQSSMPDADVVLTGISLAYYMEGRMPQRLHEEIILPARERGYKEIWLVGASMGGMGALMYDRQYPGDATGLVLLAPFLGGREVLQQIDVAGGLDKWEAGPIPAAVDKNNFDRELWRHLKTWHSRSSSRSNDVWLAYGKSDRLSAAMPPLQQLLKSDQVFVREGGHAWVVWTPAAKDIFAAIAEERARK